LKKIFKNILQNYFFSKIIFIFAKRAKNICFDGVLKGPPKKVAGNEKSGAIGKNMDFCKIIFCKK